MMMSFAEICNVKVIKSLSDSDSEILVHLYEEYGEECLSHLNGEFAFVLWDGVNQRIFCKS